jgi:hypothetical protein
MDKKASISLKQKLGEYLEKNKTGCKVPKRSLNFCKKEVKKC